ncbi:hypothetical protein AB833_22690 [Chromatiales bacterium (ex Bugula neritina AB1)]|nr:hypothetical protein AB833_22690 [Chromatiales bacterium (ex Bugula neritina AB1)]
MSSNASNNCQLKASSNTLIGTIAFGFLLTLSSGFGQTFFISLFNEDLRHTFGLSHGDIGGLYFLGTLTSAVTIVWAGELLDSINLKFYTLCVTTGLFLACISMAFVQGAVTLALAFYLLRLFGQGLSGHTGITTASRIGAAYRGRAVSLSGLGFSTAEAIMPVVVVLLISLYGWRNVWLYCAVFQLVVVGLLSQWILRRYNPGNVSADNSEPNQAQNSWSRAQVMRDTRFWRIAPALFAPPIISTGLFFHQQNLAAYKNVAFPLWASGIATYSLAAVVTSLIAGFAVDRWSGSLVVQYYLLPFIAATLTAGYVDHILLPYFYYALIGATVGIATPSISALWLEMYGPAHLASIRSLTHALMVSGSAIGPVIFGVLLDNGYTWATILNGSAAWMAFTTLILISTRLNTRAVTAS